MIDYSEMSDFEINKAVLEHIVISLGLESKVKRNNYISSRKASQGVYCENSDKDFDFNDPRKAWPIIIENSIGLVPVLTWNNRCFSLEPTEKWRAEKTDWTIEIEDRNPLRAAMIVFLMMNEEVGK